MRPHAVRLFLQAFLLAVPAWLTTAAHATEPRHPISESLTIDQVLPPKPSVGGTAPQAGAPPSPKELVESRSRQPTQPPRIEANPKPTPPPPIEPMTTPTPPSRPNAPIGTIDPRPGTTRKHPGTIQAK